MMASIHGSDTKPELLVRSRLFRQGFRFRFRVNCPGLPGKPDIKLTKYRAIVLVHGCFWHGHGCQFFRPPKSRKPFWRAKISRNRERDARDVKALRAMDGNDHGNTAKGGFKIGNNRRIGLFVAERARGYQTSP